MSRQIKGRIFPRGKSKNFYLQYYFNKKQFVVVLRDADGEPIRDRRKAQLAAQEILAPINAASRADKLKKIQEAVEDADAKAERLAAEQAERLRVQEERRRNERARIADGWRLFMSCPKRPASCRRYPADETPRNTTAGNYRAYYQHFAAWMEDQRPSAVLLSEVTQDDAAEFMEANDQLDRLLMSEMPRIVSTGFSLSPAAARIFTGELRELLKNNAEPEDSAARLQSAVEMLLRYNRI